MITNATTRSLLRRAQLCIQMNGGHFEFGTSALTLLPI
jgi:hypothetical protein